MKKGFDEKELEEGTRSFRRRNEGGQKKEGGTEYKRGNS